MMPTDPHRAPPHVVGLVAALAAPPPEYPTGELAEERWSVQVRRVVDEVWSQGWMAGATYTLERLPTPILLPAHLAALAPDAERLKAFTLRAATPRPVKP